MRIGLRQITLVTQAAPVGGRSMFRLPHGAPPNQVPSKESQAIPATQVLSGTALRHRNGRWVWVWDRGLAMHDSSGTLYRLVSSMIEITARKQAEDALRESEARFRHLADSAPALIWLTDEDGKLMFVNMHFEHIFGQSADDIVPLGWRKLIHADDLRAFV